MSRALLILDGPKGATRARALAWVGKAAPGTRVEFKEPQRSTDQNAAMWAALTDIARQTTHHGVKLSADDWKLLFLDAMKREVRMVPNLDGNGIVSLGRSSSDLSKAEMSDLLEIIFAWGAGNGVTFSTPDPAGSSPQQPAAEVSAHAEGRRSSPLATARSREALADA